MGCLGFPRTFLTLSAIAPLQAAYFVVPHDIDHGDNLLCSYPACRNEGIKFCYCAHCGIPVAKRNFRQRHDHVSKATRKEEDTKDNKSHAVPLPPPARKPSSAPARVKPTRAKPDMAKSLKQQLTRSDSPLSSSNSEIDTNSGENRAPMRSLVFQKRTKRINESDGMGMSETKQLRWTALLHERPQDTSGDDMSKWLVAVLEVSNHSVAARESIGMGANGSSERSEESGVVDSTTSSSAGSCLFIE